MKSVIDAIKKGAIGNGTALTAGECLSKVALDKDREWKTIWHHASNQALRDTRMHPNLLLPGDKLTVPKKKPKKKETTSDSKTTFVRRGIPLKLNLRFTRFGVPRAGEAYKVLNGRTKVAEGTLNEQGRLQVDIPGKDCDELVVLLGTKKERHTFKLGTVPPITEPRGIQARLANLGYLEGALSDTFDARTEHALRMFLLKNAQLVFPDEHLERPAVEDALMLLVSVHGC